ncbi:MAG: 5-(carboxyamino)imidazole ribonucleotide synthase [Eubacteriales bacterium]
MEITRIGIVGGGQLGKMMILDAKRLGYYVVILDPTKHCPAHSIADEHIIAKFDDIDAFLTLGSKVDVITYEFEHIDVNALKTLEKNGHAVLPTSKTLERIQNKCVQKQWLKDSGIPIPKFQSISSIEDLDPSNLSFAYPVVLKTCVGGYDGKGNYVIKNENDIKKAFESLGSGEIPLMVEEFIPFDMEISVLICSNKNKKYKSTIFPIAENKHVNSILDETIVPARTNEKVANKALKVAEDVAKVFSSCGMLCVEMFVTKKGEVLVNEIAPRPHNSGHYTIEGCYTSQFEQHIRAITGLPFGSTELLQPTVMKNVLGQRNGNAKTKVNGLSEALIDNKIKVHIYGKEIVKEGRKMAHITACNKNVDYALESVKKAYEKIDFL